MTKESKCNQGPCISGSGLPVLIEALSPLGALHLHFGDKMQQDDCWSKMIYQLMTRLDQLPRSKTESRLRWIFQQGLTPDTIFSKNRWR